MTRTWSWRVVRLASSLVGSGAWGLGLRLGSLLWRLSGPGLLWISIGIEVGWRGASRRWSLPSCLFAYYWSQVHSKHANTQSRGLANDSSRVKSWWKLHELSASCLLSCWRLTWLMATTLSLSALVVGTLHREAMPAKVAQVSSSSSWALDLWDPTHKVARMFLEWFLAVDYSDWFQRPSHPSSSDPTSASTLAASPMLPVEMTNSASASKSRAASQTTRSVKLVNQVNSTRVAQSEAAQPRVLWLATRVRLKAINPR